MKWSLLALWLLACQRPDPELVAQREALEQWREGKALLEEGAAEEAERRFEAALEHRPDDPVISAWRAQAVARQGDLDRAVALLDAVLARHPRFAEARYNRAAYLARLGDPEAAAADLERALEDGAGRARDVLDDPDFEPHLDHPAFAFLPRHTLLVAVDAPEGPAFLGNRVDVRLRVLGTTGELARVSAESASGPVRLLSVVEDVIATSEGEGRDLTYTFEVVGPGEVVLGPLDVQANGHGAEVPAITFRTVGPDGSEAPEVPALDLRTPSELGTGQPDATAVWRAPELRVKAAQGDRVQVDPDPGTPTIRMELRERGRPTWMLLRWTLESPPARVKVIREGETLLDGAPRSG